MTRRYEQKQRAESAALTRQRVLDVVYKCLRKAPSEPVSVERVASEAGIARSTIYLIFGSRAGLFEALGKEVYDPASYERLLEAVAKPDALQTLRDGIRATVDMYAPHRDVIRALHSMEQIDATAVGGAIGRVEENRTAGMARLARRLRQQKYLRAGLSAERAAHILWVMTSFESFDLLFQGRGLKPEAIADLLVETAEHAICG